MLISMLAAGTATDSGAAAGAAVIALLVLLVVGAMWVAWGLWCRSIAIGKNRSGTTWLILGIVFGIFALIVLLTLPRLAPAESKVVAA